MLLALSFLLAVSTPCATCHQKIAAGYAKTGMARSFYRAPPLAEPVSYYHQPSATWYSMEQRNGETWQRRWRIGYDGKETDITETRADYVMGSGNHVRTWLNKTARGTLVELPLAWYAENGGHWDMNPGHDRPYALPPRTVAYECMGCHNANPRIPAGHAAPGSEAVYSGTLPEGIDCQRCHGSGTNHMRTAQTAGAKVEDIRKAILNPARLGRERQMEVCYQCHLETTSKALPHSIVKYGREPFSYDPREPLANFMTFFDYLPRSGRDDFEIAHSAYRLRKSKCFLESKTMTCSTCHDPHDIPRGVEATLHYNGVCAQCHATRSPGHPAETDCVSCHMPKRNTQDVPHAVMTDHLIQKSPPVPGSGDAVGVLRYYPPGEDPLYAAVARGDAPGLAAVIDRLKPARAEFYVELGAAWLKANNPRNAVAAFEEALRRDPNSPVAMLDLGESLARAGRPARAAEVLNRGVRLHSTDPLLWYQLGLQTDSIPALERAVALDPLLADAWTVLGASHASAGDLKKAEADFRNALKAEPDHPDALGNLAHLLASNEDFRQAEYYFARAVKINPKDAEIHENYAVTLSALKRIDEALKEFEEAIRLRPDFGLAHLNAAAILAGKGDFIGAREHLQMAAKDTDPNTRQRALQQLR